MAGSAGQRNCFHGARLPSHPAKASWALASDRGRYQALLGPARARVHHLSWSHSWAAFMAHLEVPKDRGRTLSEPERSWGPQGPRRGPSLPVTLDCPGSPNTWHDLDALFWVVPCSESCQLGRQSLYPDGPECSAHGTRKTRGRRTPQAQLAQPGGVPLPEV